MGTKNFSNANDLITFSRSSAGTALRKIAYGSELVTNGTFDTDISGWTTQAGGSTFTVSSGQLTISRSAVDPGYVYQTISTTAGNVYYVTFGVIDNGPIDLRVGTSPAGLQITSSGIKSSAGTYTLAFVATGASTYISLVNTSYSTSFTIDNISVKEVLFDDASGDLTLFNHPADIPRIEYDADGNVLGLLVEESRTNLVTYSEERNQWTKGTIGVTDGALSINGLSFSLLEAGLLSTSQITIGVCVSPGATVTYSDYVKAGTSLLSRHGVFDSVNSWAGYVDVGWSSGVPSTSASSGASNIEYEDIGNGVYRISFSVTINASPGGITFHTHPDRNATGLTLYVSGAQLEAGAFPTSYIPTDGATATRSADVASIPVADFGYNQSVGSVVVEASTVSTAQSNHTDLRIKSSNGGFPVTDSGSKVGNFAAGSYVVYAPQTSVLMKIDSVITEKQAYKAAYAIKENDAAVCVDGSSVVTDTATTFAAFPASVFEIGKGANYLNGHIKSIKYFPRKLTNAQLQELST